MEEMIITNIEGKVVIIMGASSGIGGMFYTTTQESCPLRRFQKHALMSSAQCWT